MKRKLEVKYFIFSLLVVWSDGCCPGPEGFVHNPQQSLGIEDKPLQCRQGQSDSFYHGAGSGLTGTPGSPSFQLSSSEGHRSRHTCDNVGHTSCIITGIGRNLQNIEKTTEFMFSFLVIFWLISSRSARRFCLFSPAWSPAWRSGGDTLCTRLERHHAKIINR